jgi:hypothetical protein
LVLKIALCCNSGTDSMMGSRVTVRELPVSYSILVSVTSSLQQLKLHHPNSHVGRKQ